MNRERIIRRWLAAVTIGALAYVALAPGTAWLARLQFKMSLLGPTDSAVLALFGDNRIDAATGRKRTEQRFARSQPNDLGVQLAGLVDSSEEPVFLTHLDDTTISRLRLHFPNSAALDANLLRYALSGGFNSTKVWLSRKEEATLGEPKERAASYKPAPRCSAAALAQFDTDAGAGERLDPTNAYFALMRAVGLFEARRDADALAAVRRAGIKTKWNDYSIEEVEGRNRFEQSCLGDYTSLARFCLGPSTQTNYYGLSLRAAARQSVYEAARAEESGRMDEGIAIRHALIACAGTMSGQSRDIAGTTGNGFIRIALFNPGGPAERGSENQRGARYYFAWLSRLHHLEEVRWTQAEIQATWRVHNVLTQALGSPSYLNPLLRANSLWTVGLLLLYNAGWMVMLGTVGALVARVPGSRFRLLQTPDTVRTVVFALMVGTSSVLAFLDEAATPVIVLAGACILGAATTKLLTNKRGKPMQQAFLFVLIMLAAYAACSLDIWLFSGIHQTAGALNDFFAGDPKDGPVFHLPLYARLITLAATIDYVPLLPLALLLALGLKKRRPQRSAALDIVSGFRRMGLPIACALLLIYCGVVTVAARSEAYANRGLEQSEQHEFRYRAALIGLKWPDQM